MSAPVVSAAMPARERLVSFSKRSVAAGMLAGALVLGGAGAARAGGVQGAAAIALLNQQRAANGVGPMTENQRFASAWCPNEDHGPSGGESSRDLSPFTTWTRSTSPWTDAPLHQQDLYDPIYTQVGEVITKGLSCLGVGVPSAQPASPSYAFFASEAGPKATPYTETVPGESPYAPNQAVGLPVGKPTGPNIILYANGFAAETEPGAAMQLTAWSLKTSTGQVVAHVKKLDYGVAAQYGHPGSIAPDTAILIPPVLKPRTTYLGTASWLGPTGTTGSQTFTFTTVRAPGQVKVLTHGTVSLSHGVIKVRYACQGGPACKGLAVITAAGLIVGEKNVTLPANRTTTIALSASRRILALAGPSGVPGEAGFVASGTQKVSRATVHIRY